MRTTSVARTTTESIPRDASSLGPAIHPGEILLEEFLKPLEMTQAAAAKTLGISTVRLNELVRGKRGVTADTALRLAQLFKTTPQFWMHMQANFDLKAAMVRRRALKLAKSRRRFGRAVVQSGARRQSGIRRRTPRPTENLVANTDVALGLNERRMWQRFTERARRVVFFAQEEAKNKDEAFVGTEHILLGLIRAFDSVAARILDRLGISVGQVRAEVEVETNSLGYGGCGPDMQSTPRAKRVIDLAYEEARELNNNYIGPSKTSSASFARTKARQPECCSASALLSSARGERY